MLGGSDQEELSLWVAQLVLDVVALQRVVGHQRQITEVITIGHPCADILARRSGGSPSRVNMSTIDLDIRPDQEVALQNRSAQMLLEVHKVGKVDCNVRHLFLFVGF